MLHVIVFNLKHDYPKFPRSVNRFTSDQRCEENVNVPTEDLRVGVEPGGDIWVSRVYHGSVRRHGEA